MVGNKKLVLQIYRLLCEYDWMFVKIEVYTETKYGFRHCFLPKLRVFHCPLQGISALIHPAVQPAQVPEFLWQHMLCDLEVISSALGHSVEDSATCLHLLIQHLPSPPPGGVWVDASLGSKKSRQDWEDAFSKAYILPILHVRHTSTKHTVH